MPQASSGVVAGAGRAAPTVEGVKSATTSSGFVPQSRVRHLPDAKLRSVHGRWCATTSMELGAHTASDITATESTCMSDWVVGLAALEAVVENGDELAGKVAHGDVAPHAPGSKLLEVGAEGRRR